MRFHNRIYTRQIRNLLGSMLLLAPSLYGPARAEVDPTQAYQLLKQDVLINADYWESKPRILGAGLGFTRILGVPGAEVSEEGKRRVLAEGGSWEILGTSNPAPPLRAYTSAANPQGMAVAFGVPVKFGSGLPVEFSWPVLPSSVDPTDFRITLSNGKKVTPEAASISPNLEYNERSTVVLVGSFGNRITPGEAGAVYPVKLSIVEDDTPLTMVGPAGVRKSAVGLSFGDGSAPMTGYKVGPKLCAAKLSVLSAQGEGGPAPFDGGLMPNDGVALYGEGVKYRLRVLTTGGFSPDGVRSLYPTEYSSFFRIRVKDSAGKITWLTKTAKTYAVKDGVIRILGMADLGVSHDAYNDAYVEDHDNQIDIILEGDEAAMRRITHIEAPSTAPYSPFYNPGGPGNDPTPGVRYTKPSPYIRQAVKIAIDDPMSVTLVQPSIVKNPGDSSPP